MLIKKNCDYMYFNIFYLSLRQLENIENANINIH